MAKTAKAKLAKNTATKTNKSPSQKRTVRGKSNANELLKSRAEHAAHRGALLNPTDVDNTALSAVNPSVSKINYDVVSPGAAFAEANGIGDNILCDKTVYCCCCSSTPGL